MPLPDTADVLDALRRGRPPARPLVAPLFAALAAEVDGRAPREFLRDAGRLAVVLRDLARALPLDVLVADSGSLWDLELAGCTLDWGNGSQFPPRVAGGAAAAVPESLDAALVRAPTLEALRRLRDTVAPPTALGVVVTGPARAAALAGADPSTWAKVLNAVVRLTLEAGATVVFVQEGPAAPPDAVVWGRDLAPVWGTVRFYQGVGALLLDEPAAAWVEAVARAGKVAVAVDAAAREVAAAAREGLWGTAHRPGGERDAAPLNAGGAASRAALVTTAGDLLGMVTVDRLSDTVRDLANSEERET